MEHLLIIDDDKDICLLLKKYFTKKGFSVDTAETGEEGIELLKKKNADLVICDFKLPDYNGLEILQKIKIISSSTQVIIITGYSDVKIAVDALRRGAFDYVTKPLYPDEILLTVQRALSSKADPSPKSDSPKPKKAPAKIDKAYVVGSSQQAQLVQKHIELIAPTDMSVIIEGETGTGKEYVAQSIHGKSKRSDQPFVAVDCGALPHELAGSELFGHIKGAFTGAIADKKGCFELAHGGTLFLDEIGNLTYDNQIKLLRVLQERVVKRVGDAKPIAVDVRVIVATNENLKAAVEKGEFREDIYHRLSEFTIELSPLRKRQEDISIFAQYFLKLANEQLDKSILGFEKEAMMTLKSYYWHGNLRELGNVVKRAVLLCGDDKVNTEHLPQEIATTAVGSIHNMRESDGTPTTLKEVAEQAEKRAIIEVLERSAGNKTKTAELLDVDRKTLYNKMKAYGIEA
ncbi:MAG: sigma-54 dependent transcriptional regulator [Cyclobacteriaceae bacterium]